MSTHHVHEQLHEATHHATGHGDSHPPKPKDFARRVAIQISVIAALLAVSEMGGKNAQNTALISNQEAANLWAFFQAKTIRMTTMVTAAELLEAEMPPAADAKKVQDQIAKWKGAAARYQSEPDTGEGRKELAARAKAAEKKRDDSLSAYHQFEYGSAAFQLSIVLASAAVVTGVAMLAHISLGLGVVGLAFTALGTFAPNLLHF